MDKMDKIVSEVNKIEEVNFFRFNFEDLRREDIRNGDGFIITERKALKKVKKKRNSKDKEAKVLEKTKGGIYSPLFGAVWKDENAFEDLYRCECGDLKGKVKKDVLCPKCNTKVVYRDKDIKKTGWFYLENYKLIHPNLWYLIESLIGRTRLKKILDIEWETNTNGITCLPEYDFSGRNDDKYDNIGFIEFRKRFDEICDFFLSKKKNKKPIYDEIMKERKKVFTDSLPVIPLFLRPIFLTEEDYNYDKLNKKYNPLCTKIYTLNHKYKDADIENDITELKSVNEYLYKCQTIYMELDKIIGKLLNQKTGIVQSELIGSRYNNTGRFVITPSSGKLNEVEFPYCGFLYLYKPEIVNVICKIYKYNIARAEAMWKRATYKFDKKIYYIMNHIIENYDIKVLINRNPTLNFGSILRMNVTKIKTDYTDITLSVPINILKLIAGDFDGDTNNVMALKTKAMVRAYAVYDPRNMAISRNNGLFNDSLNLIKDQIVALNEFCAIGRRQLKVKACKPIIEDHSTKVIISKTKYKDAKNLKQMKVKAFKVEKPKKEKRKKMKVRINKF